MRSSSSTTNASRSPLTISQNRHPGTAAPLNARPRGRRRAAGRSAAPSAPAPPRPPPARSRDSRIRSGVGRLQLQPWPNRRQSGATRSCHLREPGSSARTCSRNRSLPPGLARVDLGERPARDPSRCTARACTRPCRTSRSERELLGWRAHDGGGAAPGRKLLLESLCHRLFRLGETISLDGGGIVLDVHARARADLEHLPVAPRRARRACVRASPAFSVPASMRSYMAAKMRP